MWYLTSHTGSIVYLISKDVFTIGRKNNDIVIQNDDSISRNHAMILVKDDKVFVIDMSSKYGTYLGEEKLLPTIENEVENDTKIKFGVKESDFQFKKFKINIFTSNLNPSEKQPLSTYIAFLKGTVSQEWHENCTHLTVSIVKLTVRVLCALTYNQPIVSVEYWKNVVNCVKNNQPLPEFSAYLPEVYETLLSKNVPLVYNPVRKTIFSGKIFVFLMEKTMEGVADIIRITGGKSIIWGKSKLTLNTLKSENPEYLLIEEAQMTDKNSPIYKSFIKAIECLKKIGKRSIPFQEIALAVLFASCENQCNSKFDRTKRMLTVSAKINTNTEILAPNTEDNSSKIMSSTQKYVSETQNVKVLEIFQQETQNSQSDLLRNNVISPVKNSIDLTIEETPSFSKNIDRNTKSVETEILIREKRVSEELIINPVSKRLKEDNKIVNPFAIKTAPKKNEENVKEVDNIKQQSSSEISVFKNPYSVKRKSETEMENPAKKIPYSDKSNSQKNPMVDISNIRKSLDKDVSNTETKSIMSSTMNQINTSKVITDFCPNVSIIPSATGWISRRDRSIKLEEISLENEEIDELTKWKESFRDKIIVTERNDLEIKRPKSQIIQTFNQSGVKNFKKFKKRYPKHCQSEIIPVTAYEIVICGVETFELGDPSDEEEVLSDYNDDNAEVRSTTSVESDVKRKFSFSYNAKEKRKAPNEADTIFEGETSNTFKKPKKLKNTTMDNFFR